MKCFVLFRLKEGVTPEAYVSAGGDPRAADACARFERHRRELGLLDDVERIDRLLDAGVPSLPLVLEDPAFAHRAAHDLLVAAIAASTSCHAGLAELSADDAAKFWPLYKGFEEKRKAVNDEKLALIKAYAASYNAGPVNDDRAKDLLARALAIEDKDTAAKRQFLQELQRALPGKTVARYYMVQNRIDLLTALELAEGIPLIE